MSVDRYHINDALTALADKFGVKLEDDTLNELTHTVADILDGTATAQAPLAQPGATVWLLAIDHQHGTDISAHTKEGDAWAALARFVRQGWAEEMDSKPEPDNDRTAIATYFQRHQNKSYRLTPAVIQPAPPKGPPALGDHDYLECAFGYGTLDDLAEVLDDRNDMGVDGLVEIKRRMAAYGPEPLWDTLVGPMLNRMEVALELHLRSCSECGRRYTINGDGTTNHLVQGSTEAIDYDVDEEHVAYGDDL